MGYLEINHHSSSSGDATSDFIELSLKTTIMRKLTYTTLILAFAQIVFGAIVRITGSGMGCGDHWPKCNDEWFPPHDRIDLIIEITHRYLAAALTIAVIILAWQAFKKRNELNILKPAVAAIGLVLSAALLGAVTVKMGLNPFIVATHLTIAMSLLATLALIAVRTGGFGAAQLVGVSGESSIKTFRAAKGAVVLTFIILILGALTANIPGAAGSCVGFPWCRAIAGEGTPLIIQIVHRVLAFLLFFHLLGVTIAMRKRNDPPVIKRAAWLAFITVLLQIFVAAAMVEAKLPPALQSLHQAVGTLAWLTIFTFSALAARNK
jgi:cytochrome c oxidase assembly protein subunit 15